MRIYTSYWGNAGKLREAGVEPVAISRGKPKGFSGRAFDNIAPTWAMLKMSDADYDVAYAKILSSNDPHSFVRELESGMPDWAEGVALLCWERDPMECHRTEVARWLRDAGYQVEEWSPVDSQMRLGL